MKIFEKYFCNTIARSVNISVSRTTNALYNDAQNSRWYQLEEVHMLRTKTLHKS